MKLEDEILRIFVPFDPKLVILFGSRSRDDADDGSDVDIVVVYQTGKRFLARLDELYAAWDLAVAVDILAYTPEEFERMKEESAFVAEIAAEGKVIHEAA